MPPKISKKSSSSQSNQNIFLYEWEDIPLLIQMKFLELLTLSTALKMIFMCKLNINRYAEYIIHRLKKENFKYKSIQIGEDYNLTLHQDGSLYSWGENYRGQLGLGHCNNRQNTPQRIDLNHFHNKAIKSIHTGSHHTLALMEDNSLYAWGHNYYGKLGLGHNEHQSTPQLIDPSHYENQAIQSIHTKFHYTLALMEDDSLYAWGQNNYGQLGLGHNEHQNTPQLIDPINFDNKTIQSIHTRSYHTLALMEDGSIYAWGYNDERQLGLGHNNRQNTPQLIDHKSFDNKTIKSIHTGNDHTLALMNDDSLFAWGGNYHGQLGLGHNEHQNTPQLIDRENFPNIKIKSIYTGSDHTLALMTDGSFYAWGRNNCGQLGLGHNDDQNTPQRIDLNHFPNKKIKSIQIGDSHTLALIEDGSLYSWGANHEGQLGLGHNRHQSTPLKIEGRLERAFRLGHENLVSLSMFGNKSSEERRALKNHFLSQHVLNGEINEVPTQRTSPGRQA